ncbi:MAG: VacJ family lipoprotein [Gammaproteobacteria bacterium]|nr:VacJ family lipoprotein [Gammaproteobacteria bacterium]
MKGIPSIVAMATLCSLGACANTPPQEDVSDPLEPVNRVVDSFNDKVDRAIFKPAAQGYEKVVPATARSSVTNFFGNLGEPLVIVNQLLQGKGKEGVSDTGRFLVNSTIGLFGLFDPASQMGLTKHNEDFGQTFGHWGIGEGWYVVLPLLGPSTVRDTAGKLGDYQFDAVSRRDEVRERNGLSGLRTVDTRANLLSATKVRDTAALDNYLFTREAYRQLRWNRIYDGNPPPVKFDEDEE